MSVFGSLFTAVSALSAQSQALSMISNNIANSSTIGYKETDAAFESLVTNGSGAGIYSPGSVSVVQNQRIDQQGILQQSTSATDLALSGSGFFVVKDGTGANSQPLYTRAGSFSEDQNGILTNTAGFQLQGWPLGADGSLPASAADISSLVPVNVAFTGGLTQPTTTASLAVNLNSAQASTAFPVTPGFTPDFTRNLTVYDSLGSAQNMTVSFKKESSPTASTTGSIDLSGIVGPIVGQIGGIAANDAFDLNIAGASFPATAATLPAVQITIGATTSVADLMAQINSIQDVNHNQLVYASLDSNGQLNITANNINAPFTLSNVTGTPLGPLGLTAGAKAAPAVVPATDMLTGAAPPNTPNSQGWWDVQFTSPTGAIIKAGSINFGGNGKLNAALTTTGAANVDLPNIDWGNGSNIQDISFNIGGFSQFAGDYNVVGSTQNGAALGLRTGLSVDSAGVVTAQFSNGESTKIYQLPVATFANPNGLNAQTGNVFQQSGSSGDFNLREAGQGSAGTVQGGALEASNVDLADEFSKMIVTQQAYSSDTKVIQTADQMMQALLQLQT